MRVLVDEGVPRQVVDALRRRGLDADRFTPEWRGMKNGSLLDEAARAGFDVLLTDDKSVADQNNLRARPVAVVALPHNRRRPIMGWMDDIADTIRRAEPHQHVVMQLDGSRIVTRIVEERLVSGLLPPVQPLSF